MPGTADKFTQSAQSRLLRPGMTVAQSAINASLQNALDVNHKSQLEAVSTFIVSDFRTGRASAGLLLLFLRDAADGQSPASESLESRVSPSAPPTTSRAPPGPA